MDTTHFADDATLKRLAELEQINAELVAALEAVTRRLEHVLKKNGISALPTDIKNARAAIAKARNVAKSHHLSAINVDGEQS